VTVHFIITRPLENCDFLNQYLPQEFVTYLPVIRYANIKNALKIKNEGAYDYIVTSQYAAKMIVKYHFAPQSIYYCVGSVTEKTLQDAGYITTSPRAHNAQALVEFIKAEHKNNRDVLYLCGETIKHPIHAVLQRKGIPCKKRVIYKITPIQNNWKHILQSKGMKTIVFYSKQSYDLFIKDVKTHHHITNLEVCHAIWVLPTPSAIKATAYTANIKWKKISVINSTSDLIQFIHKENNL